MQTLIIGDIQGCSTALLELVSRAGLTSGDAIIALGDLVDRGPDSPGVLEFFMTQPNARVLMGNHERKHVRSWRGEVRPALSQRITRQQLGEERYHTAVAYMATLPWYIELPDAILVHAFFEPGVPLAQQREQVIVGSMRGEVYLSQQYDRPWFELYDGDKPIIVGHRDYTGNGQPFVYRDRVYGLDTGCCFGGALTGLLLPAFRLVSVPARRNYWADVKQQYADLRSPAPPEYAYSWEDIDAFLTSMASRPDLTPAMQERVAHLQGFIAEAEGCLTALYTYITQEHARVISALRAEGAFETLPSREQGRRYAARLGSTPLAPWLHRARKGKLRQDDLRRHFKKPGEVMAFARQVGLLRQEASGPGRGGMTPRFHTTGRGRT
jgi:serine/threonine protein phosphatase 1